MTENQLRDIVRAGQPHYKKTKEKEKRDDREKQEGTHGHKSQIRG